MTEQTWEWEGNGYRCGEYFIKRVPGRTPADRVRFKLFWRGLQLDPGSTLRDQKALAEHHAAQHISPESTCRCGIALVIARALLSS